MRCCIVCGAFMIRRGDTFFCVVHGGVGLQLYHEGVRLRSLGLLKGSGGV